MPAKLTTNADHIARAMRGVFAAFELWGVSSKQVQVLLGFLAERAYYAWRSGQVGAVPHDVVRRVGCVLGIFKALQLLYRAAAQAPIPGSSGTTAPLAGRPRCSRMAAGDVTDLAAVHAYLEAYRGAWS